MIERSGVNQDLRRRSKILSSGSCSLAHTILADCHLVWACLGLRVCHQVSDPSLSSTVAAWCFNDAFLDMVEFFLGKVDSAARHGTIDRESESSTGSFRLATQECSKSQDGLWLRFAGCEK